MASKSTFGKECATWVEDTKKEMLLSPAQIAREFFVRVCEYSPRVGNGRFATGHFLHNWRIGARPIYGEIAGVATLSTKVQQIQSFITDDYFAKNKAVYFTNSTSYASYVEYSGWKVTGPYEPALSAYSDMVFAAPVARSFASMIN
jgi:hypothetical protein